MRKHLAVIVVIALGLAMLGTSDSFSATAGPTVPGTAALAAFDTQHLTWGTCPGQPAPPPGSTRNLQCAAIQVPLDYHAPSGATITVTLSRLPAADQQHKKGTMIVFPAVYGFPELTYPLVIDKLDNGRLGQYYDLVSFDQRGNGASTPIYCGMNTKQWVYTNFPIPSPQGIGPDADTAKSIADACVHNAGAYLPHVNTADAARDMDVIRSMLGISHFTFLGTGYGSTLGLYYMGMFPGRVTKAVFDSLPDTTVPAYQASLESAPGFYARFRDVAAELAAGNDVYGLGATADDVQQTYLTELGSLDAQPVQLAGVTVDGIVVRDILAAAIYADQMSSFGTVVSALVHHQNEQQAAQLVTALNTLPLLMNDQENSITTAVWCNDSPWSHDVNGYATQIAAYDKRYPVGGAVWAAITACAFWPAVPRTPVPALDRHGPRNILVLQNQADPIYAYSGALAQRQAFGNRARMVSVNIIGTQVLNTGVPCATTIADDYLLGSGTLPPADETCGQ